MSNFRERLEKAKSEGKPVLIIGHEVSIKCERPLYIAELHEDYAVLSVKFEAAGGGRFPPYTNYYEVPIQAIMLFH